MADSLFDIAYRGYTAPMAADMMKQQIAEKKLTVQAGQMELQNTKAMQDGLQQIWGPGGGTTATDAASNPTPDMTPKLQATAGLMFKTGNVKEASSLLTAVSMSQYRAMEAKKITAQTQKEEALAVGGIFNSIDSQEAYSAALPELQAKGIDIQKLGLSGDYQTDAPKLQQMAKSTMTAAQQTTATDRETNAANLNDYRNSRLTQLDQGLGIQMQRLKQQDRRITDNEFMQHHKINEDALKDSRAQEGLDMRKLGAGARTMTNALKVQQPELKAAQGVFATDDRTQAIPQQQRDAVAGMAAMRAKRKIAADIANQPAGTSYEPEDYDMALEEVMQDMEKEGLFKPSTAGTPGFFGTDPTYSHVPPKAGSRGGPQAQGKPLPAAATANKYADLPSLLAAQKDKKISRDDAIAYARKQGWVQ